ncbi:cytochrome P450 [[Mycobacterium] burgundiense]|uniref:Cytochrome P450 n=1 Tax=[Mycobacterium] burgundiense TaxID=3064286 RepID=A0ABM9LAB8_9MYCO|nr:cytochrome P450 [Mycolicibacterium sp. MU0053]CAJ1495552.1 cytochrome P450 [Mycolicibacterium sp. MU0053]
MAAPNIPSDFDFLDSDVNLAGVPVKQLAELRKSEPVHWVDVPGGTGGFGDKGYWLVTKHADVREVSRRSDVFASSIDGAIPVWPKDMTREAIDLQRNVLLNMDAPHHTRLRRIISRGFTPRAIGRLEAELNERAQNIAKTAVAGGIGDFVEQVSCELPLQAIADLLGVPQDDRDKLFRWSNEMTSGEDPEYADVDPAMSSFEVITYAMKMAEERTKNPGDDIVTQLIQADIEGEKLTDDEFAFFVIMLAVAGNETSRNSITHGMIAFSQHPDQWELYKRERPQTAVDEIIRWATPVSAFQRTAAEDTELSGVQIKKGERVVMSYRSANFDEEVFENPETFNILRDPNPHVGFGGTGAHYCIGANLARMTVGLIFNAIADHMPDLTPLKEPERLKSGWLNGVKHWQVDFTGQASAGK